MKSANLNFHCIFIYRLDVTFSQPLDIYNLGLTLPSVTGCPHEKQKIWAEEVEKGGGTCPQIRHCLIY